MSAGEAETFVSAGEAETFVSAGEAETLVSVGEAETVNIANTLAGRAHKVTWVMNGSPWTSYTILVLFDSDVLRVMAIVIKFLHKITSNLLVTIYTVFLNKSRLA